MDRGQFGQTFQQLPGPIRILSTQLTIDVVVGNGATVGTRPDAHVVNMGGQWHTVVLFAPNWVTKVLVAVQLVSLGAVMVQLGQLLQLGWLKTLAHVSVGLKTPLVESALIGMQDKD